MAGYGEMPFGLRDVKLTDDDGQVDLPRGQNLAYRERVRSGELSGDDALQAAVAFVEAIEWSLEAGGISLEAWAKLTGRDATEVGTSPTKTMTMSVAAGDEFPYIKIYGKSLGDAGGDVHVKFFKAKCTSLEGTFAEGEFFVTSCSGLAVDDGVNGIVDIVQNETAADLPAT